MSSIHIIISGASSVGKTTHVDQCLNKFRQENKFKHFQFKRIQEVARTVLQRLNITGKDLIKYINQNDVDAFSSIQKKIISEQILSFDKKKEENYFSDRSGFDALAYIHSYFPNETNADEIFHSRMFKQLIDQCRTGLIFLIQPHEDLQAQNDNMRIIPNYNEQIEYTKSLQYWYKKAQIPFFLITDLDLNERVEFIRKHLNGHFHWLTNEFPIPLSIPFHLNKPKRSNVDQCYMRFIEIIDQQNLKISYKIYQANRLVEKYDPACLNDKFASILFDQKLDQDFIKQILFNGIGLNHEKYHFIGCSNSQLRGRSCYLYAGSPDQIQRIIDENGDFDKIKNLSKRMARIGLLFSSCTPTIDIPSDNVIDIDDVERNGHIFTDG